MSKRYVSYEDMSESGKQFSEIWEDLHDPIKREEKKIKENRKKRSERIKQDSGL